LARLSPIEALGENCPPLLVSVSIPWLVGSNLTLWFKNLEMEASKDEADILMMEADSTDKWKENSNLVAMEWEQGTWIFQNPGRSWSGFW
jgi:hypothetical protein